MVKKIFLSFSFLFIFTGCGNIEVYSKSRITDALGKKVIHKNKVFDNKINDIYKLDTNNDIENAIKTLESDMLYYTYILKNENSLYKEKDGFSFICFVIASNTTNLFDYLVKNVKDKTKLYNHESSNGCTPLKYAIYLNNHLMFRKLLDSPYLKINIKYVDYAIKYHRAEMAYSLLSKIYNNNIPIEVFVKYAKKDKKFRELLDTYFENQILALDNKKIKNYLAIIEKDLKVNEDKMLKYYIKFYKLRGVLANDKYNEKVLYITDKEFHQNYYNPIGLKKYLSTIDKNSKKYSVIYKRYVYILILQTNSIKKLQKIYKECETGYCKKLAKNKIFELKKALALETIQKFYIVGKMSDLKWHGKYNEDGWPVGNGYFTGYIDVGHGMFGRVLLNYKIGIDNLNKTFKNIYGYVDISLREIFIFFPYTLYSDSVSFNGLTDMNKKIYTISNSMIKKYKKQQEKRKKAEKAYSCFKMYENCKKNCKYKNDKNGFFIFSSSDKHKCETYCSYAYSACKDNDIKRMKQNICYAKCVGYNNSNGGFFSRSDYQKCLDNCLGY
jgi:hypothetical protein